MDRKTDFDIRKFYEYRENNRLEVKRAKGGLPESLWGTYSSMANCYGGVILLGVIEKSEGSFATTGMKDVEKLRKDFWNTINNGRKVSFNLLTDDDVESYEVEGDLILAIHIPRARREVRPVYINDDLFGGTFRRNGEGDYHCTKSEVKAMLRDQTEETSDMKVLEDFEIRDLNLETVHAFRNRHAAYRAEHVWEGLPDEEYLERIGAAKRVKTDMFNMIGIGERAGSGVPDIYAIWKSQAWEAPVVSEQYNPDRTILTLVFSEKQAEKTSRKNKRKRAGSKNH